MEQGGPESRDGEGIADVDELLERIAQLEERVRVLDELAHQDSLVPIPNRRGFMRSLDSLIARVSRYGEKAAMLFVDIDGLKRINDSFGHSAGDEALIEVARVLTNGVRRSDCVARLGGDEFGILLAHADEDSARETAQRLGTMMEECERICDGNRLPLSIAIGITVLSPGDSAEAVIARADSAMYRQKAAA